MKHVVGVIALVFALLWSSTAYAQDDPVQMCVWNIEGYYDGPFETVEWDFHGQQSQSDNARPIGDVVRANPDGTCPATHVGASAVIEEPDYEWVDSSQGLVWESHVFCGLMAGPPGPYQEADPNLQWDYIERVAYHPCPEGIYQLVRNENWFEGSAEPRWFVERVDVPESPAPAPTEVVTTPSTTSLSQQQDENVSFCRWAFGLGPTPPHWQLDYASTDFVADQVADPSGHYVYPSADGSCPSTPPSEWPTEEPWPRTVCGLMAGQAAPYTAVEVATVDEHIAVEGQWDYFTMSVDGSCPPGRYQLVPNEAGRQREAPAWLPQRVADEETQSVDAPTSTIPITGGTGGDDLVTICRWVAHGSTAPHWAENRVPEHAAEGLLEDELLYAELEDGECPGTPPTSLSGTAESSRPTASIRGLPNTGSGVADLATMPLLVAAVAVAFGVAAGCAQRRTA